MYLFSINDQKSVHAGAKKIPKEEFAAVLEAKEMIEEAKKEAAKIIEEANKAAVNIKEDAQKKGYEEGLEPFNVHILHFEDRLKHMKLEIQNSLLPIVNATVKRIVGDGLTKYPELVYDVVAKAISQVTNSHEVKLFVHKDDLLLLEEKKEDLKKLFDHLEMFQIEERNDVEKGSCIIQTEKGILNANLTNQYEALKKALLNAQEN